VIEELVDVLDDAGQPLRAVPRAEAHAHGLLHRCVHVLVQTPDDRLWLQKRALDRALWPGLWTSSASGHVDAGETEAAAAGREGREELGFDVQPRRVGEFRYRDAHEHEQASVWVATSDAKPRPGPEVMAVMAVGKEELATLRARLPGWFTPTLLEALKVAGWA
jgi:isopentenyldiphosphate isomerase